MFEKHYFDILCNLEVIKLILQLFENTSWGAVDCLTFAFMFNVPFFYV